MFYECVKCQRRHYERDPLYGDHIMFQSKHGLMTPVEGSDGFTRPEDEEEAAREAADEESQHINHPED